MYNRYIPQPDGSYRRNRIQEPRKDPERKHAPVTPSPAVPAAETLPVKESCPHCPVKSPNCQPAHHRPKPPMQNTGALSFLKQLLPAEFDAEDLLVILLLLLMTGNNREDQNSALLTLLIYVFL